MSDRNKLHGLCPLNTLQGPYFQPSKSSERNTLIGHFAGTRSCLLRAGEEGLSLVTVTELTLCQPPHLETVTRKEEARKPRPHDPAVFLSAAVFINLLVWND